jgi:tRNA pseudouridine55 synthase
LDGILNVDKPAGISSYRVVARIKRLTGEKHVGHAGTLDPDATGVLPVCLGKATRIVQYLTDSTKTYIATIELGICTDTYDAAGKVTQRADASGIDRIKVDAALVRFRGAISQTPPMYSALKYQGQPLYKLAREGISVERKSRAVTIHKLEITDWQPPEISLEIECTKGTYIRSLAHDLGQALGCGAYLKNLKRTRCGIFEISEAVTLAKLEEPGVIERFLLPMDRALGNYRATVVDEAGEKAMKQGNLLAPEQVDIKDVTVACLCRAYARDRRFLGLLRYIPESGKWVAEKVLTAV